MFYNHYVHPEGGLSDSGVGVVVHKSGILTTYKWNKDSSSSQQGWIGTDLGTAVKPTKDTLTNAQSLKYYKNK